MNELHQLMKEQLMKKSKYNLESLETNNKNNHNIKNINIVIGIIPIYLNK